MVSLREKLRAARVCEAAPVKRAPADCMVCERTVPLAQAAFFSCLDARTLRVMQGEGMPGAVDPARILFLDTETTGLGSGAGTVAFLVGVGRLEGEGVRVRQYLMRDYDEEPFVLARVLRELEEAELLVTFNGKSFDLPLLASRFVMHRMRGVPDGLAHADLLHTARRVFRLRLGRCTLSHLEACVLGLAREDDLPGALVPERYFTYLKTRDLALLEDVLRHNREDIVSLARLLWRLCEMYQAPEQQRFAEDVFSLGRAFERRGLGEQARKCYRAADRDAMSALSRARLADSYRRDRRYEQAAAVYERMIAQGQCGVRPYVALAKIAEHRLRDVPRALEITERAIAAASEPRLTAFAVPGELDALYARRRRLLEKQRRNAHEP